MSSEALLLIVLNPRFEFEFKFEYRKRIPDNCRYARLFLSFLDFSLSDPESATKNDNKIATDHNSFVIADLTKGLDDYANSFDIVHCRCVAGHVWRILYGYARDAMDANTTVIGLRSNGSRSPNCESPQTR